MQRLSTIAILAGASLSACFILYLLTGAEHQAASPLALIIIACVGWFFGFQWKLAGSILVLFAGTALVIHPFLFSTSYWYSIFALPLSVVGVLGFISWWKQNGRT
ncbi:MAG: hypothetical protein GC171_03575 [Terrimonas sp.]|nr:hypothetical protein [Terrimonas sp.]